MISLIGLLVAESKLFPLALHESLVVDWFLLVLRHRQPEIQTRQLGLTFDYKVFTVQQLVVFVEFLDKCNHVIVHLS